MISVRIGRWRLISLHTYSTLTNSGLYFGFSLPCSSQQSATTYFVHISSWMKNQDGHWVLL